MKVVSHTQKNGNMLNIITIQNNGFLFLIYFKMQFIPVMPS